MTYPTPICTRGVTVVLYYSTPTTPLEPIELENSTSKALCSTVLQYYYCTATSSSGSSIVVLSIIIIIIIIIILELELHSSFSVSATNPFAV
jgi:hypothetical protein